MTQLFANNAASELASAVTSGAVSLTLKTGDGAKFPSPSGGDFFLVTMCEKVGQTEVNHEIVKCTARSGDVLTVTRAQEGTTARAFSADTPVELRLTAATLTGKQDVFLVFPYDNRASLRALTPAPGDFAAVRGLGIFAWQLASTRPDDDETVFATTGGAWELVAADPDYVHAHLEGLRDDVEALEWDAYEAAAQAAADALAARILRGTFSMSLTSLAATTSSSFTCTVTGAAVGDSVIVNPGNGFGTSSTAQARLSYVAYVSAANTVTVTVRNASAATAAITASTWTAIVIKQ